MLYWSQFREVSDYRTSGAAVHTVPRGSVLLLIGCTFGIVVVVEGHRSCEDLDGRYPVSAARSVQVLAAQCNYGVPL